MFFKNVNLSKAKDILPEIEQPFLCDNKREDAPTEAKTCGDHTCGWDCVHTNGWSCSTCGGSTCNNGCRSQDESHEDDTAFTIKM